MKEEIDLDEIIRWVKKNPDKSVYLGLALVIGIAFFIRISNLPHLFDQLMGLDPYVFYRYSQNIIDGTFSLNDTLRYWPNGFDVLHEGILHSFVNVGMYYIANALFGATLMQVFQLYPAIFGVLALIMFFFLVNEIFNNKKVALLSTAFLSYVPAFLFRTSAGFADKEPIAVFLIFTTLLFFLKSLKEEQTKKSIVYAMVSGISMGLGGLSWGGVIFAFETIAVVTILEVFFNRMNKRKFLAYFAWILAFTPFFALISHRYGGIYFFKNTMILPSFLALFFSFFQAFFYEKIKKYKPKKIPSGIFSTTIWIVIGALLVSLIFGVGFVFEFITSAQEMLLKPMGLSGARVAESVAENQPPFFYGGTVNWWGSLGFIIFLFFGGVFLLALRMFEKDNKVVFISLGTMVLFIFIIFSRFSPDPAFSMWNSFFGSMYIYVFYGFWVFIVIYYFLNPKTFEKIESSLLLILIYALFTVMAGRGAIRNLFSAAPPICALAGFFIVKGYDEIKKATKDRFYGIPLYVVALLIIGSNMNTAYATVSQSFWTSIVDGWVPAMQWIRTQTEQDAVFLHWWDYGYWVQTLGNRTTVLDGGNYENPYKIARHFFTSNNMSEIREILEHYGKPNYLLIVDDDIPKFYQIQRIAGRDVWFTPFYFTQKIKNPFDNKYEFAYALTATTGSAPSFVNLTINRRLWSSKETYIMNLVVPTENNTLFFNETYVYLINPRFGNFDLKINCLCWRGKGCTEIRNDGFPSCIVPIEQGAILVPYQTRDMLFTRLYVLNETIPGFDIAYDNGLPFNIQGIVSQGQTHIQIWRINYTEMGG